MLVVEGRHEVVVEGVEGRAVAAAGEGVLGEEEEEGREKGGRTSLIRL